VHFPKFDTSFTDSILRAHQALTNSAVQINKVLKQMPVISPETHRALDELSKAFRDLDKAEAAFKAGWVPFPGMPIEQFDENTPVYKIHSLLEQYTSDEWPNIKARLWESVKSSDVDDEALATYNEALQAHDAGLFRCVVRVLFPEIERVARETVYGGERYEKHENGRTSLNTSLRNFRKAIRKSLPVGIVTNIKFALALIEKMHEHLYDKVGKDEASLERFRTDPVPNRHASQHGYVIYSSRQNSLNTLAMTDFMFRIIMRTNAYMEIARNRDEMNQS
jgi:hypothetical protein